MKHRHLVDGVGYTPTAVEDILERGTPADWVALRDAVAAEPMGPVAQTVLRVCDSTAIYGASPLWKAFVLSLQAESRRSLQASGTSAHRSR